MYKYVVQYNYCMPTCPPPALSATSYHATMYRFLRGKPLGAYKSRVYVIYIYVKDILDIHLSYCLCRTKICALLAVGMNSMPGKTIVPCRTQLHYSVVYTWTNKYACPPPAPPATMLPCYRSTVHYTTLQYSEYITLHYTILLRTQHNQNVPTKPTDESRRPWGRPSSLPNSVVN